MCPLCCYFILLTWVMTLEQLRIKWFSFRKFHKVNSSYFPHKRDQQLKWLDINWICIEKFLKRIKPGAVNGRISMDSVLKTNVNWDSVFIDKHIFSQFLQLFPILFKVFVAKILFTSFELHSRNQMMYYSEVHHLWGKLIKIRSSVFGNSSITIMKSLFSGHVAIWSRYPSQ